MDTDMDYSAAAREGDILRLTQCARKDTNRLDINGMTPVHWAALYGKLDALRILIQKGGNPDKVNTIGSTAVHLSAGAGHLHCLVFLTNYGCNVYSINDNGATPMQEAVSHGKLDCMRHIEALVTHQVSLDKVKVEKAQAQARRDFDRRVKGKNKVEKRGSEKQPAGKGKQLESSSRVLQPCVYNDDDETASSRQRKANTPWFSGLPSRADESSASDMYSDTDTLPSSDCTANYDENNPARRAMDKVDKSFIPHPSNPSRSSSIIASLRSCQSTSGFIGTGGSTANSNLLQSPFNASNSGSLSNKRPQRETSISYDELVAHKGYQPDIVAHPPLRTSSLRSTRRPMFSENWSPSAKKQSSLQRSNEKEPSMATLYTLLHSLQLDEYGELFKQEQIDLTASLLCTEDDLREIGLPVGPRKKFLDAVCKRNEVLRGDHEMIDSPV